MGSEKIWEVEVFMCLRKEGRRMVKWEDFYVVLVSKILLHHEVPYMFVYIIQK